MVLADVYDDNRTEGQLSALPGFETRLVDADDLTRDLEEGQLLVRARHQLSTGYANAPSAWADRLVGDGWFLTEDVFRREPNGRYVFRGRADDIIVTSGYNVAAVDVEAVIRSHPGVADVAVSSTAVDGGVAIRAAVVLRQSSSARRGLVEEIQNLVRERLGRHAYPRVVDFVDDLARTPSGKLHRLPPSPPADAEGQVEGR
jgi:acetyl-CoA synthetase